MMFILIKRVKWILFCFFFSPVTQRDTHVEPPVYTPLCLLHSRWLLCTCKPLHQMDRVYGSPVWGRLVCSASGTWLRSRCPFCFCTRSLWATIEQNSSIFSLSILVTHLLIFDVMTLLTFGIPLTEQLRVALYPAMTERFTKGCVNLGASAKSGSLYDGGLYSIPEGPKIYLLMCWTILASKQQ